MLQDLVIKNFRCFESLLLRPLARINLIAGKNNTGKTALLEALHLYHNPNNCILPIDIHKERGIADPGPDYANVCSWLFFDREPANGIEFSAQDDAGVTRSLQVRLVDPITSREQFPELERQLRENFRSDIAQAQTPRIILTFEEPNGEARVSALVSGGAGSGGISFSWMGARVSWSVPSVFIHSGTPTATKDVEYFGNLESAKRQGEILPCLRILEPNLQRLSLIPFAGQPVIHGDIGLSRLVPVPLMGEGLRRLLSIVLAIVNAREGVVLIDEIENGLHYSVMKEVWKALAPVARQAGVQVFATTHSYECIQAAHRAFKETGPYELRYFRLDRRQGEIVAKSMDEPLLDAVEKSDLEVR